MSVTLSLNQIFTGASASLSQRWSRCDFLDKEIFAHPTVPPLYWPGFGLCLDLPGLPPGTRFDGVLAFYGHLMGFQGSTIKWSDVNDFTNFIPVASTIQNIALTLQNNFTQLAPGVQSGWIFVNESTYGMVADMFIRLDYAPYYNFYTVNAVSLVNNVSGTSVGFDQVIPPGATGMIFTVLPLPPKTWASATTTPGVATPYTSTDVGFMEVEGSNQPLQITGQSAQNSLPGVLTTGFTAPAINSSVTLSLAVNPGWAVGDYLSLGGDGTSDAASLGRDMYLVTGTTAGYSDYISSATSSASSNSVTSSASSLPTNLVIGSVMLGQLVTTIGGASGAYTITLSGNADATITAGIIFYTSNPTITIQRTGIGSNQQFAYPSGTNAITQPYVEVLNIGVMGAVIPANSSLVEAYGLQLTLNDLTGIAPVGSTFIGGTSLLSLNANEAGELVNAGDRINGPIWAMATSGLYAVIMKERSFQSIQYVGAPQIFNIWAEFSDEGLLGRNTWCKVGENTIYFWGHRAFFQFAAGSGDPTPIGQKQFVQVLAEIDLTRISEACMYHKEDRREVWFVYPVQGFDANVAPSRVFVYNYEQGSISVDDYADLGVRITEDYKYDRCLEDGVTLRVLEDVQAQSPITAVGALPVFTTALTWADWTGRWEDQLISWQDLTLGRNFLTLMGLYPDAVPALVAHGAVYDRDGESIFSAWETVAHDGGDPLAYKYVDLIQFSLSVDEVQLTRPFKVFVQIGVQANLDGSITWSTPQWVDCSGNGNYATKLNFKMAGRFITARWWSNQADCQWRVAGYEISGRLGNTY